MMLIRPAALFLIVAIPRLALAQPTFTANDYTCFSTLFQSGDMRADLDGSGTLTANDYITFQRLYAERDPRANCDGSTSAPAPGWTDLTPPPGAQVFYVAANGNDSNPGTQAAPFRTLAKGYSVLRAGQPDQVLLRSGDTFTQAGMDLNKGSGSLTTYMVIGSYGTGPRPKIRSADSVFGIYSVRGLAIVGLDIQPSSGHPGNGIWMPEGSSNILIEDCLLAGFGVNVASHRAGASGVIDRLKIRRNVFIDPWSSLPQSGHNLFLGEQTNLLIEENVFDRGGRDGGEQTIFRRNVYIHDSGGVTQNVTVLGNLHARSCSDSIQVRPGGNVVRNNLSLQNPTGMTSGGGTFEYNVAIDAKDINSIDRRGTGFELFGTFAGGVRYNIVAHQQTGTENINAFALNSFTGTFAGNFVYDWKPATGNPGWQTAVQWEGGGGTVVCDGNRLYMVSGGMLWRHESAAYSTRFTYRQNLLWTSTPSGGTQGYMQFSTASGVGHDWNSWKSRESNSTFLNAAPSYDLKVGTYLASLGVTPGTDPIATFMTEARKQSKQNWRQEYTAGGFNTWARGRAGVVQP